MTLIVEDGTGLDDANAYISVATANDYFLLRGNENWDLLDDEVKEACIVKATDYIDMRWRSVLRGAKATETQALEFPRIYVAGGDATLPPVLFKACAEYAYRESIGSLIPDPTGYDETGRLPTKTVDEVGPIREERAYATAGGVALPAIIRPYPLPDGLMKSLIGSGSQLVRA